MSMLQVSERIIRSEYIKIDEVVGKTITSNESEIFIHDKYAYKILKPIYRFNRLKNMYLIEDENFPHSNNIINTLYQGDKFIGVCTEFLEKFKTLGEQLKDLNLYETKIIFEYIIDFMKCVHEKNLNYWDIHLENMGTSNNSFFITDIDSMEIIKSQKDIQYCYHNLLTLFYELAFNYRIRKNNPWIYREKIYMITGNEDYMNFTLNMESLKDTIKNTTQDFIDEKRYILK